MAYQLSVTVAHKFHTLGGTAVEIYSVCGFWRAAVWNQREDVARLHVLWRLLGRTRSSSLGVAGFLQIRVTPLPVLKAGVFQPLCHLHGAFFSVCLLHVALCLFLVRKLQAITLKVQLNNAG